MSDHDWCRDVSRDEAVRAAEDAAAVPSIQHRDLPEVVAALTERVARLEAAQATIGSGDVFADVGCGSTGDEIARLTAERDAAIRERDAARARVAELEAAPPPRGWLTEEEREAVHVMALVCDRTVDAPRANTLRALLARSTPPMVKVPPGIISALPHEREQQWHAAIRAAGGEVEE